MTSTTVNSNADFNIDSASTMLAKNWWLFLLRGIFGIIFGLLAFLFPGPTMLSLVLLFSAYMLVDGVAGIISAVRAMRRKDEWGLLIFEGLLNIAVGVAAFIWPGLTVLAFVFMVAAWAIISGALMMAAGFRLKLDHGRWISMMDGRFRSFASLSCIERIWFEHSLETATARAERAVAPSRGLAQEMGM
ncbi:HdeD family acid-resistance protein [Bradyrhizobium sp. CCBAU 11357]|uniref:HdeD family acid-resistance protein n=1 Tax=Bradyrhizobium sp. CCBAU 11357 TaxID=1630808 RepID=UPI0023044A03|nr:HdeD family acid-resistance protein [Bradyrhizobium sp. CCBAU 11357]